MEIAPFNGLLLYSGESDRFYRRHEYFRLGYFRVLYIYIISRKVQRVNFQRQIVE
jgi:hypothetical protein